MKKLIILLIIMAMLCVTAIAAAADDGIEFDSSVSSINEGATLQTVLTRKGEAEGGEVTYTSSSVKTATVDENGLVTAKQKGRVVITAVVKVDKKSYKAQLKLEVVRPVASLTVNESKLEVHSATDEKITPFLTERENTEENELPVLILPVKKKATLVVTIEPKDASNRNVAYTSSDDNVFTAAKGAVTGIAPGEAILTIASESNPEVTARYRVLVVQPVKKIAVESSEAAVVVGQQVTVTAKVEPEDATVKSVKWSSGDERFVTVDSNGTVTGIKRGTGRIIACADDGSSVRANYSIKVVQNPESISLQSSEITVDVGRNVVCKATILPTDTDNKKVKWSSSDESIASVDKNGKITGNAIGDCTITCTSDALETITTSMTVHVQQPVKKLTFNGKTAYAYVGEGTQLTWNIEPDNATNKTLEFKSAKENIATVDENGIVTGVASGKTAITATTTDGSKRKATITVQVGKHVSGIQMYRKHAYIDPGQSASTKAIIEPKDALNKNIKWESSDPSIVTAVPEKNVHVKLTGVGYGDAVVTGTTEDGGFQATFPVTVGDFDRGVSFLGSVGWDENATFNLTVKNETNFVITEITALVSVFDGSDPANPPLPVNTQNGSNKVDVVWSGQLKPGQTTGIKGWRMVNFRLEGAEAVDIDGSVTVTSYQIEGDWVKTIQPKHRTTKRYGN